MGMTDVALVALGGALGSVTRMLVGRMVGAQSVGSSHWPWQTFLVNVTGAFVIGLMVVVAARFGWPSWWRPLLAVGVLGGYTTFSTFSLEIVEAGLTGNPGIALAYGLGSLAAGVAACWLGVMAGRAI